MKGPASPRLDRIPDYLYQHYLDIIGNVITNLILKIFNNNDNISNLNQTFIYIIRIRVT